MTNQIPKNLMEHIKQLAQSDSVGGIKVNSVNDGRVCDYCKSIDGNRYTVEAALKLQHNCASPNGCRCWASPIVLVTSEDAKELIGYNPKQVRKSFSERIDGILGKGQKGV